MQYPIVQIKTKDNLNLHGLFLEAPKSKTIFLHTHGTAGNFYEEDFTEILSKKFLENQISVLFADNRGAYVYDSYQKSGAAVEKFEDCIIDLDAWVGFTIQHGYENIILSGHSLGTEKAIYYMKNGNHEDKIRALVLLAPSDSVGYHLFDNGESSRVDKLRVESLLKTAQDLIAHGQGDAFLPRDSYGGIIPKSAESFVNFLGPGSELSKALPFHKRRLELYSKIDVPILAVIGDQEEYTAIPVPEALELLKKENPRTENHQLKNCNHDFEGKEDELASLIFNFIQHSVF